jgi:CRP-like cAMP-binding protein
VATLDLPKRLTSMVDTIHPLTPAAWAAIVPLLRRRTFGPREHLSPLGSVETTVGLLESGRVRAFYTTADGKEYNKHFFTGPDFVGDYASLLTGRPVEVAQQTLTACTVWLLDRAAILALEDQHPSLIQLQRRFAEGLYLVKERRELEMATMNAAQRYARLIQEHPGIEVDVPLYEIAAYLGITPTQLSRVRTRRKSKST